MGLFLKQEQEAVSKKVLEANRRLIKEAYKACIEGGGLTKQWIAKELIKDQEKTKDKAFHGYWMLVKGLRHLGEERVRDVYFPTYYAVAMLANVYMSVWRDKVDGLKEALIMGMDACCNCGFLGHGVDEGRQLVKAMQIMGGAGVFTFVKAYPEVHPEFDQLLHKAMRDLNKRTSHKKSSTNAKEAAQVYSLYSEAPCLFAYGTLKKGKSDHGLIQDCRYIGNAFVDGCRMYVTGQGRPAAVWEEEEREEPFGQLDSRLYGELYEVADRKQWHMINQLEQAGAQYEKYVVDACMEEKDAKKEVRKAVIYCYKESSLRMEPCKAGIF